MFSLWLGFWEAYFNFWGNVSNAWTGNDPWKRDKNDTTPYP